MFLWFIICYLSSLASLLDGKVLLYICWFSWSYSLLLAQPTRAFPSPSPVSLHCCGTLPAVLILNCKLDNDHGLLLWAPSKVSYYSLDFRNSSFIEFMSHFAGIHSSTTIFKKCVRKALVPARLPVFPFHSHPAQISVCQWAMPTAVPLASIAMHDGTALNQYFLCVGTLHDLSQVSLRGAGDSFSTMSIHLPMKWTGRAHQPSS